MTVKTETVELTLEDCRNIVRWWTVASMVVETKLRSPFSESEHKTITKVVRTKEQIKYDE